MTMRVWGVSRLADLRQCPAMFNCKYENKSAWVDVPSAQMDRGSKCHKDIEEAIAYDVVIDHDPTYKHVVPYVNALCDMKHNGVAVVPEFKFGMDIAYQRVDFFRAPNLRVRCAVDVFVNDNGKVLVIDWKTGRFKPEHEEHALFYGAFTEIAQRARDTTVQYVYLDEPQNSFALHIDDSNAAVRRFYAQFEEADAYLDEHAGNLPTNPGKHCGWCGNIACQFNKNDKAKQIAQQSLQAKPLLFQGGA